MSSLPLLFFLAALLLGTASASPPPPTALEPGVPVQGSVPGGEYAYFEMEIPEETDRDVTFSVTPIGSGDPDLYCSTQTEHPDDENYEKRAIGWGADSITFQPSELPEELPGKVYCSVRGWIVTDFVMVAFFESALVDLVDGTPQSGALDNTATHLFSFTMEESDPETAGPVTFSATALAGELKIFVSNNEVTPDPEDPETYQWKSQARHSGEALVIYPDDSDWPAAEGRFSLTLLAYEDATSYSLVAATNGTNILLRDGLPQQGNTAGGNVDYFKTILSEGGCDLTVTITPTSGDPDLYMAEEETHPRPGHYDRRSWGLGGDAITYTDAAAGTYYIGVHAYATESTFVIVSRTECNEDNNTQWLLPGVPQHGRLERLEKAFFKLEVRGDDAQVNLAVTREFGDPDLYVTTDGTRPSLTNYQFNSVNWGEDLLEIHPSDPGYCGDCDYWIMVWAASNTSFSLTGSTSKALVILREGVPIRSRAETDEYTNFRFSHDVWGETITFSVTDLGRGDPDIYISTSNPEPDMEDHMWSSQDLAEDSITIPPSDPGYCNLCTYFLSVHGYGEPTTFTIVAAYDEIIRLADGVPQTAHVHQGASRYFLLQSNEVRTNTTFSITNSNGVTNLFITACENATPGGSNCAFPISEEPDTYHWSVYGISGDRSYRISEDDEYACRNAGCLYVVAVEGTSDSDFTLLGHSANATIPLQSSVPQEGYIDAEAWQYYSYEVDAENRNLAFIVTPLSGDPDIYVSLSNPYPSLDDHDKSGVRWGEDIVDFVPANISKYWVGVVAYTATSYTITALESRNDTDEGEVIQLLDGQPQTGLVYTGSYAYFSFNPPAGVTDLTYTLTRRFGDPDVYVQNDTTLPTRENYRWSSTSASDDLIRITDPAPGEYLAGVYGYSTSSFTITATTGITTLQDSIAVRGQLGTGEYRYYRLRMSDPNKDLVVTVTPFDGDPDLYMSREIDLEPGEMPNMTNWKWASQSYLGDSITVPHTDEDMVAGNFIVGVYSYIASSYSLMFSVSGNVTLQDGIPQAGSVARKAFKYYRLQVSSHNSLTLSLTPMSGNPNLYVTSGQIGEVIQPTLEHWDRRADGWYTGNQIIYDPEDPDFCSEEDCMYWVGVYGEEASNFSVIATTDRKSIALQDGVPVQDHSEEDAFSYFRFHMTNPGNSLIVTVTPLTGDPDIYADDEHVYPNETNAKWVARGNGEDALSISDAEVGFYYIGVYGYTNTSFTITALVWNPENDNTVHLVDGVPQRGAVPEQGWMYYNMSLWSDIGTDGGLGFAEVTFMLSKLVGDPDLYITNDGTMPSLDNWKWRSHSWGEDSVRISEPEDGTYTIGVHGFTAATFTILGATESASRTLLSGVPFTQELQTGKFHYFKFLVDDLDSDLTVSVTGISGDPDLFMSAIHEHPNSTHSEWRGQGYLEDSITVPSEELEIQHYFISVYAYQETRYTIVANLNATTTLQNGVPQSGYLPTRDSAAYYQVVVPEDYPDLSIYLSPLTGSFYLFVSHTQKPIYNDPSTYQWSSWDATGQQQILMRRGEEDFCDNCTRFYIMAYSAARGPASFNLVASTTTNGLVTLIDAIPQRRQLEESAWEYFRFSLSNPEAAVIFSVTPISGDPDMYISTETHRPSQDNHTWASEGWGEDVVNIDYTDPDYITGDYYIGIHAFESTTYTISAQVIDLSDSNHTTDVLLFNGQPQIGFLAKSQDERYFRYVIQRSALQAAFEEGEVITIAAVPRYGDPDLFVYIGEDERATQDNAYWSSRRYGRDAVTIDPEDEHFCDESLCVYKITVQSFTPSLFTITATVGAGIRLLEMSVPFRDEVEKDEYRYFQLSVNSYTNPLVIAATVLSSEHDLGDPDMFIAHESSGIHYPNQTHNDWSETHFGSDIFSLASPKLGFYYVSVRGYRPTSFSITAWNGPVTLLPGEPQKGVVTSDASALFIFSVNRPEEEGDLEFTLLLDNIGGMDVDMWLCNNVDGCTDPGPDENQWNNQNATESGIPNLLTVLRSDPDFCEVCLYYLRVTSNTRAAFTLNAGFNSDIRTLVSGKPVTVHAPTPSYRYFRARVDGRRQQDIFISSTLFTGDVVILASFQVVRPTEDSDENLVWKSDRISAGAAHLTLSHLDSRFRFDAPLFVSVRAFEESRFTLSLSTGHLQLLDGQPILGVVPKRPEDEETPYFGAQFFFQNQVPEGQRPSDIAITLNRRSAVASDFVSLSLDSPVSGLRVQEDIPFTVYVTTSDSNQTNPGPDNFQWSTRLMDLETLLLPTDDPNFCSDCTYFVAVYGEEGSQFSVKIATANSYVMLLEGERDHSSVRPNRYRHFGMFVDQAENFTAIVEPCVGSVAVYASQSNYRPTKERHTWKSDTPSAIQEISNAEGEIRDQTFYLAVLGRQNRNSEFLIHAHTKVRPAIHPIPGDVGAISSTTNEVGSIRLSFAAARAPQSNSSLSSSRETELKYVVHYRRLEGNSPEQEGAVMFTECGLKRGASVAGEFTSTSQGLLEYTVKGLSPGAYYTFNIVAHDPETEGLGVYDNTPGIQILGKEDIGGGGGVQMGVIFGVAIPLVLLALICFGVLWHRNRKLTRAAKDIQMHDVPDQAVRKAVRDPTETGGSQAKKYHQLLADEDTFPTDDLGYSPPAVGTQSSLNASPVNV